MKVVGLDIATHLGMALVGEDEEDVRSIEVNQKGFSRVVAIAAGVERKVGIWSPDFVVMEDFAFKVNINSFILLVEITTAIKLMLFRNKIPWLKVRPSVLKKWATGEGNADKPRMAECAQQRWGFKSTNHDIVDAYCLARLGYEVGMEAMLKMPGVTKGF